MKKLYKQRLTFESTIEYFKEVLYESNALSIELLKSIDFKEGEFFTILPKNAEIKRLYLFTSWILKQNPIIEYGDGPKKARYQRIPTIQDETAKLIIDKINKFDRVSYIFDDVIRHSTDIHHMELFHAYGLCFGKDVYYLVNKKNVSQETITNCLQKSNAIWHSLCILTEANFDDISDKQLTQEKIKEICREAKLVLVGAYDGEGYIFWEKAKQSRK